VPNVTRKAIDMRLRPPVPAWLEGSTFDAAMFYPRHVAGFAAAPSAAKRSLDLLFEEMDQHGIALGVVVGRQAGNALGGVTNDKLAAVLQQWPERFVGLIGVDLDDIDGALGNIRTHAKIRGFKGISVEPGSAIRPMLCDDDRLTPIYELAQELELPVSISLSSTLSGIAGHDMSWASPIPMQRVAMRFPNLTIIASHAAWPYAEEMVAIAIMCPNIYVSPDIYIATYGMPASLAYIEAANIYLEDRMLFGTAYPSRGHADAMADFFRWPWRPEIVDKILYANAARLLRL
jgi:hypothetical protein